KVAVGDEVALDQEIVEVSTAKAVVVIPSPHAGTVAELHGAEGDVLEVGTPLITFEIAGDEPETTDDDAASDRTPNLVGYGAVDDGASTRRRRRHGRGTETAPEPVETPEAPAVDSALSDEQP